MPQALSGIAEVQLEKGYLDASPEAPPPPTALLRPKCSDLPQGKYVGEKHAECWEEIANWHGCYLWRIHYHSDQPTTRWTGQCRGGVAEGHGTHSVSAGSEHPSYEGTGTLVGGKANGSWYVKWANDASYSGEYRDGKRHGRGAFTFANFASRYEGEYRDDKQHGRGTFFYRSGSRYEGAWRDDERHGHGTYTFAGGNRYEGAWRDGKPPRVRDLHSDRWQPLRRRVARRVLRRAGRQVGNPRHYRGRVWLQVAPLGRVFLAAGHGV